MANWIKQISKKIAGWLAPPSLAWRSAAWGLIFVALAIWSGSVFYVLPSTKHPLAVFADFIIGLIIAAGFSLLCVFILAILAKIPKFYLWALGCFIFAIYNVFYDIQTWTGMVFIYFIVILFTSLLAGALGYIKNAVRAGTYSTIATFFCLLVGVVGILFISYWLVGSGTDYIETKTPEISSIHQIALPDPALPGPFSVAKLTYGSGLDYRKEYGQNTTLISKSVDGSMFVDGWDGVSGWLRTWYWGFNAENLPLNGIVWFPEGKGPFPLVLIVHGNHEMEVASETGYEYLGSHFASQGFIAVSIDENFLNSSWLDWGDLRDAEVRGWLLLEHLQQWRTWNKTEGNPFYGKVDMENISLIGHSRGGEAIAIAAALNPLQYYPDDASILFDYHFHIKSLAAIAPVDGNVKFGGVRIGLENVDYFVMHGSLDGDVRSFEGFAQYQSVNFKGPAYHFKAALYVVGANHGQFNTIWGKHDITFPGSLLLNVGQLMPVDEQQKIAKVYLSAFINTTLKGKKGYIPLFRNYLYGGQWLPPTLYFNEFEDSTYQYVLGQKDDIDITKISLTDGSQKGENLKVWRSGVVLLKQGVPLDMATYIGWNSDDKGSPPSYSIYVPEKAHLKLSNKSVLVLSLADASKEDDPSSCKSKDSLCNTIPIDFSVVLIDKNGQAASLPISSYSLLHPQIESDIMKASILDKWKNTEVVFETIELPLKDFFAQNPKLDIEQIKTIRFAFDKNPQGLIVLDKVAFTTSQGEA